ncbi:small-conductance mechanosensitive channel [Chthonomonas calidirosea]|uniref:Small-conductance mechanosensitive channel n=1 Tax=Chthonomonas calidirosea (strain DSM 23976 / ICMP 18418 / T49) TaxID=1303518 RepID=S0EUP2_CHTCT|nr:mechanosensitive ion channel domain-containing protein [Chthonomonas calidirosea]CCW34072.1 Small-conductance mechanosensitive channel [Chthonomonas calidirosea T49]CEK15834.1 small-conductance mechanosensitive channel [Chthonomonas calidirosea]
MPLTLEHKLGRYLDPVYWQNIWHLFVNRGLEALIQVVVLIFLYFVLRSVLFRIVDGGMARIVRHHPDGAGLGRMKTLQGLARSILSYLLFFIFGVLILKAIGVNIIPFIEAAGVIGLAIGFGAQKLVRDMISGFFIIVDNTFMVGEMVTIAGVTGVVQNIGMRVTRIVDNSGRIYMIANGDIGTVTNLSRNPIVDFVEINVAASADLQKIMEVVEAIGKQLVEAPGSVLKKAPTLEGIMAFSASSMTIRVSLATDPIHLSTEQMRLRGALREAFIEAGIALA